MHVLYILLSVVKTPLSTKLSMPSGSYHNHGTVFLFILPILCDLQKDRRLYTDNICFAI